jgi:hypothetical protein
MNLPRLSMMSTTPEEHLEAMVHWASEAEAIANTIMEADADANVEDVDRAVRLMQALTALAALEGDLAFTKKQLRRPTMRRDN